jgi:putative oxidoreductase
VLMRWGLAGVFLYAGFMKLTNAPSFAAAIARFQLIPDYLIHPLALALPPLEIFCGLALLAGPWKRQAALAIALLSGVFLAAVLSAASRGIEVECSCFGSSVAEPVWMIVVRDLLLLSAAVGIYLQQLRREPALFTEMGTEPVVLQ